MGPTWGARASQDGLSLKTFIFIRFFYGSQLFQKEPVQNSLREPVQNSVPNWLANFGRNIEKHRSGTFLAFPVASHVDEKKSVPNWLGGSIHGPREPVQNKIVPNWLAGVPNWLELFRTGSFRTGSRPPRSPKNEDFSMDLTTVWPRI